MRAFGAPLRSFFAANDDERGGTYTAIAWLTKRADGLYREGVRYVPSVDALAEAKRFLTRKGLRRLTLETVDGDTWTWTKGGG